jgi:hypothetical protein
MITRKDLKNYVIEALKFKGGKANNLQIAKFIS